MKKIALIQLGADDPHGSEILDAIKFSLSEHDTLPIFFSNFVELNPDDLDALIIPGSSNLLQNLTTFGKDGYRFKVDESLEKIILKFHLQSKPIGVTGLASLIAAQVLKKHRPLITLGETSEHIPNLTRMNIQHENCPSTDYITDRDCKLLSTPSETHSDNTGIRLMIKELVEMA